MRGLYRAFWDTEYWPIFLSDTGIFVFLFILGYGIFRNFGIWDIGIYFGIRIKLILGYGIYWTVYFGICDIAYPLNQASYANVCGSTNVRIFRLTLFVLHCLPLELTGHGIKIQCMFINQI